MFQELKFQLSTAILTVLTLAAGTAAVWNLDQQYRFRLPDDGVIWVDRQGGVEALSVMPRSPGANAGVHAGDRLESIQDIPVAQATDVARHLAGIGSYNVGIYQLNRRGIEFTAKVLVGEVPFDLAVGYQYMVGFAYLIIGLFVYYRRGSAHKAQHFYILCLASFIFLCSHYTGQLDAFDKIIYYANIAAGLVAAAAFLHFCVTFPERLPWFHSTEARGCPLRAWSIAVSDATGGVYGRRPHRDSPDRIALDAGPGVDRAGGGALSRRRVGADAGVPEGGRPGGQAADQMAAQRRDLRHSAVRGVVRFAVRRSAPSPINT